MSAKEKQSLAEFVSSLQGGDGLRVEESFGDGYVRLRVSEAERRQAQHDIRCVEDAVIEMLRNARDAGARQVFVASSREGSMRTIVVLDDGSGIPKGMHERVFDARVTSKLDSVHMDKWGVHGRGMALFSISQNAKEARVIESDVGLGAAIVVRFDVSKIGERADQSTWPTLAGDKDSSELRGPRNIVRACAEFALESKNQCNVYVGSPSEVVATLRRRVRTATYDAEQEEEGAYAKTPLTARPGLADDAKELSLIAAALGLPMSERNAHRIIRGQIEPLINVRTLLLGASKGGSKAIPNDDPRTISMTQEEREELSRKFASDFEEFARRYYVSLVSPPKIRMGKGSMRVTFEYEDSI